MELKELYQQAAQHAFAEGIDPGNEEQLVAWIRANCSYRQGTEFFLVLGIGCEIADLQAQQEGFKNQFHRAAVLARQRVDARRKPWEKE